MHVCMHICMHIIMLVHEVFERVKPALRSPEQIGIITAAKLQIVNTALWVVNTLTMT